MYVCMYVQIDNMPEPQGVKIDAGKSVHHSHSPTSANDFDVIELPNVVENSITNNSMEPCIVHDMDRMNTIKLHLLPRALNT